MDNLTGMQCILLDIAVRPLLSSTGQNTNGKKLAISMGCVRNAKNIFLIMAAILGYKMKNQVRITINHLQLVVIK